MRSPPEPIAKKKNSANARFVATGRYARRGQPDSKNVSSSKMQTLGIPNESGSSSRTLEGRR